jgi:hypothetical protein
VYALFGTRAEGGSSIDAIYNISSLPLFSFRPFFITFLSLVLRNALVPLLLE